MEVIRYRAARNFGDDLNDYLWPKVLPRQVWEQPDLKLLGIGTIIDREYIPDVRLKKRVVVLGSGAGYGPLPRCLEQIEFLAVRGPLTARLVGRPDAEVTDAAALMSTIAERPLRSPTATSVLFMPHHRSLARGRWEQVTSRAGVVFVDPRWPVERTLPLFSQARLVIAEAMHAAIVADSLRVPWVPVMSAPILTFKWIDWTSSLGLPYTPEIIPWSSAFAALQGRGRRSPRVVVRKDPEELVRARMARMNAKSSTTQAVPQYRRLFDKLLMNASRPFDEPFIDAAADVLCRVASQPGFLSDEAIFSHRVDQLQSAVERLTRERCAQ